MNKSSVRAQARHAVGRVNDIAPGQHKIVEVDGRSIGIFNVEGAFVAVLNICPHEFAPVCLGRVGGTTLRSQPGEYKWGKEGEILACPWHGWEFDLLSGEALADKRRLKLFPVEVEQDTVYVILARQ